MVKDKNDPLAHKEMLDTLLFENHNVIKVTGECGDQCFGSDALHANLDKHANDWETVFSCSNGKLFNTKPDVQHKKITNIKKCMSWRFYLNMWTILQLK